MYKDTLSGTPSHEPSFTPGNQDYSNHSRFSFNSRLDTAYLNDFYRGDLEQAALMFEVFLNITARSFTDMLALADDGDWAEVQRLAHKMKPTFELVGLTDLASQLSDIEYADPAYDALKPKISRVKADFYEALPIVMEQKHALDHFLCGLYN